MRRIVHPLLASKPEKQRTSWAVPVACGSAGNHVSGTATGRRPRSPKGPQQHSCSTSARFQIPSLRSIQKNIRVRNSKGHPLGGFLCDKPLRIDLLTCGNAFKLLHRLAIGGCQDNVLPKVPANVVTLNEPSVVARYPAHNSSFLPRNRAVRPQNFLAPLVAVLGDSKVGCSLTVFDSSDGVDSANYWLLEPFWPHKRGFDISLRTTSNSAG